MGEGPLRTLIYSRTPLKPSEKRDLAFRYLAEKDEERWRRIDENERRASRILAAVVVGAAAVILVVAVQFL